MHSTSPSHTDIRLRLMLAGYSPIPVFTRSKKPAIEKGWQTKLETNEAEIRLWDKLYPNAISTGLLCQFMPVFDIDILNPEAAEAVEELVRSRFEDERILVRIGLPPKRAILSRTIVPFAKITANLIASNGAVNQKFEFLGKGQQVVAYGLHKDTGKPYTWHGGEPGEVELSELPLIGEEQAQALIDDAVELLAREHGYKAAATRPRRKGNGQDAPRAGGVEDWSYLTKNIQDGRELHDSLRDLSAKMVASGMGEGAVVNHLRGLMEASTAVRDDRWQERYDDIPRLVSGAKKFRPPDEQPASSPQGDSEPVDLWGSFEPPTLPRGLLPEKIEYYARVQAETMGVDPGGIAMAALAVCAGAIPDAIRLVMKRYSLGWTEAARLWVALVGMPSTKKSPIIYTVSWPLARLDAELVRQYISELRQWEQLDKDERKGEPKPVQERLRLEDTTIEACQEALAGSPNGLLLIQDELSGFFGSMDKYSGHRGATKDRAFWLQAYNGGEYALNRINRGVTLIPNLSVSLLGGIQPDLIRRLANESLDDGFLQRMLVVLLRPAEIGRDVPQPSVAKEYNGLVERLTRLRLPVSGRLDDNYDEKLHFDDRAQDIRRELEAEHHAIACVEAINPKLAAHVGKYDGLFGRLCVAFHCVEHAYDGYIPEFVSGDTAERVAQFMRRFLLQHALAFYGGVLPLSNDHDRLASVAGYVLAHKKTRLTNRDIQRSCHDMRKLARPDTEAIFQQLEALGWLAQIAGPRPTSTHWLVNPKVHEKFAERARTEAERRKRVQAIIVNLEDRKRGK